MILRGASDDDRDRIIALLDAASLPTLDLVRRPLEHFVVAEEDGVVAGCVGAEVFGRDALLRSLVVARSHRGRRIAGRLVERLEANLGAAGVVDVWLLTIDADGFFSRLGYESRSRDDAPEAVRQTEEFASLCPGSAILMRNALSNH